MKDTHLNIERRSAPRQVFKPREIAFLCVKESDHIPGTNLIDRTATAFVELIDRNKNGVGLKSTKPFAPNSDCYLITFNPPINNWDMASGILAQTSEIAVGRPYFRLGVSFAQAETKPIDSIFYSHTRAQKPTFRDYPFLSQTDLIKSLPQEAVCPLLNNLTFTSVRAGKRFIIQGEAGDTCYLIQKGSCLAKVEKDGQLKTVARLREGDIVGEMAILTGERRSAHVESETDMELWALSKDKFDQLTESYTELRSFLTAILVDWLNVRTLIAKREIGKYIITDIMGSGAFSIVYRGYHKDLKMPVAVKMMKHDMAMESEFLDRFKNEAKTIARFHHRHIVRVYDYEERYRTVFIVMEHLKGVTLRQLLKQNGALPENQVLRFLIQICNGLAYAHQYGIVHQDIKPGNIFILPGGQVKILDFGLACSCATAQYMDGTPLYMAPEQIECFPVDERTDIYSLGVTAFEMLTGRKPYAGKDAWAAMNMQVTEGIPDPAEYLAHIAEPLRRFIRKACRRDPDQRYPDITAITRELTDLMGSEDLSPEEIESEAKEAVRLVVSYETEKRPAFDRLLKNFQKQAKDCGIDMKLLEKD